MTGLYTHVARYCDPQACPKHWRPRLHLHPRPAPIAAVGGRRPGQRHAPGGVLQPMSGEARMAAYRAQNGRLGLTARQYRQVMRKGWPGSVPATQGGK